MKYWHAPGRLGLGGTGVLPGLRQQPGPGPGRLGWLAWFEMLLGLGGGAIAIRLGLLVATE